MDLEKLFASFGAYHQNRVNIFIHALSVWPIFFTAQLLFYFTPPILHLGAAVRPFGLPLVLNFGFLLALLCALLYVSLDPRAGSLAAALCALCWVGSSVLGSHLGFSLAWKVVIGTQLFCWTGQFIGHTFFEGRPPALLNNNAPSYLTAPFFVLLEVLHSFSGYEPYPGFHSNVQAKMEAELETWNNKQKSS